MNINLETTKKIMINNFLDEDKKKFSFLKLIKPIQKHLNKTYYQRIFNIFSKFHQFDESNKQTSNDRIELEKRGNFTNTQIYQTLFGSSSMNLQSSEDVLIKIPISLTMKPSHSK